ncbi:MULTISPECIES: ferredoxin--NADP reductase [unclassified Sphingomonas]|uniref:ferredoxin--NADP reductase n=1 Tax=unclassified Sphingomonas TaxID=196159 RepID=UPI000837822D|nr:MULTISPECIES: ferredoxin--NADP reductase [unclassified Sphingomonas]MCH4892314.1 ferredoxin--NADP reductase [Sphingomonas sp. SFZ2018-12]
MTELATMEALAEAKGLFLQKVTWVHHWTPGLFSFRVERPQSFRFTSGEFVMIGLAGTDGRPLLRAYSIVSPAWEDHLEFFSVKVADGALTSRLQHLQVGDHILMGRKTTGTLVADALEPGKHLMMIGTGTGLAPFMSILRDPETHERFGHIVVAHTVRQKEELAYSEFLGEEIKNDEIFGEMLRDRFTYYPTVTRGAFHTQGRITDRIRDGRFGADMGLSEAEHAEARWMICGSIAFNAEMIGLLEGMGLREGTRSNPGQFVVERAFVG